MPMAPSTPVRSGVTHRMEGRPWAPAAGFALATMLALVLAGLAPLALSTLGLLLFGVAHNVFELRYLACRNLRQLPAQLLILAIGLTSLIALRRLLWSGVDGERLEIALGYALLGALAVRATRARVVVRVIAGLLLGVSTIASLSQPALHFVVLAHLHNLLPVVFLWWWSTEALAGAARWNFRLVQLVWAALIPLLFMTGVFDTWVESASLSRQILGNDAMLVAQSLTPSHWQDSIVPWRLLAAFAFLQTMHYVIWCGFLPWQSSPADQWLDQALDSVGAPHGRSFWWLASGLAVTIGLALIMDYAQGKSAYVVLASYHAYLELAVLMVSLLALGQRKSLA